MKNGIWERKWERFVAFIFFFLFLYDFVGWLVYMFLSWRGIFKIYMCVCELLLWGGGFINHNHNLIEEERGEGYLWISIFLGQFRVFGDCVYARTGGVRGGRYHISLSFSLFLHQREREIGVCFGGEGERKVSWEDYCAGKARND